jgi:nucleoside-diphosphate kinase
MTIDATLSRTLVLLKPDAVSRGLMGEIISRIERSGMKIIACKLTRVTREFAAKHYFDVAERRGEHVLRMLLDFMTSGPILALCVEGVDAADNLRRLVGSTEPRSAAPGTIRGDFSHASYGHSDATGRAIQNLVHASGHRSEAEHEIALWFSPHDYVEYTLAAQEFTLG